VAAEEGRSISALLTDRLEAIVRERKASENARRHPLARLRQGLETGVEPDVLVTRTLAGVRATADEVPDRAPRLVKVSR
jgi:hypothetical protein